MKKIFTIFAAMLLAVTVNAGKRIPLTTATADALRVTLADAGTNDGDTLVLAEGTYVESPENYVLFSKSNVVMPEEGAEVIIKPQVSIRVSAGKRVEFNGVKIDGSLLLAVNNWYENLFEVHDATAGNCYVFKNCEVYGIASKTMLRQASGKTLDSLIIDNCYIHDNAQATLRMEDTSLKGVIIKNTTIANVANGGSFWCAPINIRKTANDAKVIVDHCTFYHNTSISTSYADVTVGYDGSATSDVTISNCIFAQPSSYSSSRAINLVNGGVVKNCLTNNYTESTNGIKGATSTTDCITGDPLFRAPANSNFTLNYGSPAYEAGTESSTLGDPRWHQSAHTVYCKMQYEWWTTSSAAIGAFAAVDAGETKVNKAFPGVRMTAVGGQANMWEIELAPKYRYLKFARMNPSDEGDQNWGAETSQLEIPNSKYNLYTITSETAKWKSNSETVSGDWSMWPAPVETDIQLVGEMNGWNSNDLFTVAGGGLTASYKIHLDKNGAGGYEFKILKGANMMSINNGNEKYGFHRGNTSAVVDYNNAESKPCWISVDYTGDYTFTWTYATNTLTITYPEPRLENGYYLVGKFGKTGKKKDKWDAVNITSAMKFAVNPSNDKEYLLTTKLYEADSIKVVKVEFDVITTWYPSDANSEYIMTADQAGDSKTIYFRPDGEGPAGWHYNYIYVPDNGEPTAIDETFVSDKAVKKIENGMLIIEKNGVRYNILGTVVK